MKRSYYAASIREFLVADENSILGELALNNEFPTEPTQRDAWSSQIEFLKGALGESSGYIYFEFAIPRMGKRIDTVVIDRHIIFVIEFKVGQKEFLAADIDQVWDYALDLKNFHETTHSHLVAPILIATHAKAEAQPDRFQAGVDRLFAPIKTNLQDFSNVQRKLLDYCEGESIDHDVWVTGRYSPTPTIIEAATALYRQHSVEEISRKDAAAKNLKITSSAVSEIIANSKSRGEKAICFVTGVPGAGKTLVGLDIATRYLDSSGGSQSVFLSGNGPLVAILTEALAILLRPLCSGWEENRFLFPYSRAGFGHCPLYNCRGSALLALEFGRSQDQAYHFENVRVAGRV